MADLSNPIDQIQVGQANKETTANELFDASSPATVGGRRASTCAGLVWGYYGGRWRGMEFPHATLTLDASEADIYIVIERATGVVSFSTSDTNWNDATDYDRLYWAETGPTTVTDYDDYREMLSSAALGATGTVAADAIWDAKGDLVAGTGANAGARVVVGTNGQTLYADSTQSTGVRWDDPAGGSAADVTFDATGLDNTAATDVQQAGEDFDAAITTALDHISETTGAHAASAISVDTTGYVNSSATELQTLADDLDAAIAAAAGGVADFTDLGDVPSAYTGESLKIVRVNVGETALEFTAPPATPDASDISVDSTTLVGTGTDVQAVLEELDDAIAALGGGVADFTDLGDVPSSYTGEALKVVRVNAGETALEFAAGGAGGAWGAITGDLEDQIDLFAHLHMRSLLSTPFL